MDFSRSLSCIQDGFYCRCTNIKQQFTGKCFHAIGIADKMKSVRLVQIFRPIKETNRTHSKGYVEDLSTQSGRKRCAKMAVLNLSVLPIMHAGVVNSGRRSILSPFGGQRQPIARRISCLRSWVVFAYDLFPNRLRPYGLSLGQVSKRGYCHGTIRVSRSGVPRYNLYCSNQGIRKAALSDQT